MSNIKWSTFNSWLMFNDAPLFINLILHLLQANKMTAKRKAFDEASKSDRKKKAKKQ